MIYRLESDGDGTRVFFEHSGFDMSQPWGEQASEEPSLVGRKCSSGFPAWSGALRGVKAAKEPSRDDKTAIELFLIGVRALALQSSIIDVVRIASRFSTATG